MEIKDIEKLADLAKIELSDNEKQGLVKDLDSVLGYVKQIESVEVENIEPEYQSKNIWREDERTSSVFSLDLIINQFPDEQDGFVKVKKIL
jgi:aspartyl-tRNA(Asn)/glutamyl-tRNA(Gln) amidotransferase subunit C